MTNDLTGKLGIIHLSSTCGVSMPSIPPHVLKNLSHRFPVDSQCPKLIPSRVSDFIYDWEYQNILYMVVDVLIFGLSILYVGVGGSNLKADSQFPSSQ